VERVPPGPATWAEFVEPDFPFFSSVLDARDLGPGWPTNNLTPRGLILNLGNDCWACFDTELLRMSVIWEGKGITPESMAQGSYHQAGHKASEGQEKLPQIIGTPWMANGIYPGWQAGEQAILTDPREAGPDKREVGRGPLAESLGRFKAVRLTKRGICLEYEVAGASVREWVESRVADGRREVRRRFQLDHVHQPLWLMLGHVAPGGAQHLQMALFLNQVTGQHWVQGIIEQEGVAQVRVRPSKQLIEFDVVMGMSPVEKNWPDASGRDAFAPAGVRWPQTVITKGTLSPSKAAYVLDDIPLPTNNSNRRNVRLADIAFFGDGRAAAVTFDGDVWIITGLKGDLGEVLWKRFASGLHEPLSLCIRNDRIFVFDRNGIWQLRDTDGNDEADVHELFSNAFAQTAETREFATSMKLAPDGSFIIAKGGQQGSTLGKHNGTVLRVSPDGKAVTVIGWGLRQPFIGVHPKTGMVTASDQQGNYVPATPLHLIRDHQYYGFLSALQPKEKYPAPIADPLTWIPHPINASGATQVWLTDPRMGPLNDALIHLGYNRPEIFLVRLNTRAARMQAAVVSLTRDLDFAPLSGAVNPADGQLYVTGFQIWGTTAKRTSGLARVRYTAAPAILPREVVPMDKGILLRFDVALDAKKATDPANFSVERWNYRRTASYGSPHFKLDGSTGQEWMTPSSAYLSRDNKSVFIGIPDMKPAMQMRIGWALATRDGDSFEQNAYFAPYELTRFAPVEDGFKPVTIDLTPRTSQAPATPVTVEEGRKLSALVGCTACHSTDGVTGPKVGPTWKGLFGSQREFKGGEPAVADEAYLRESILEPTAKVVLGFEKNDTGMPSYAGVLTDAQVEALILYIKTLK
jgi:mono/diheme cytochrome c family protein